MVAFEKDLARFNYRVAGVAIHNGRILLDRNARNSYWVFPGGHPEMMEPMADALTREVREEIGEEVEVVRLLWVLENFFNKGKDIHEISFYFLMNLRPESRLLRSDGPFYGDEHGGQLIFQWFPIDEAVLLDLPLFPSPLISAVQQFDQTPHPQHIVFHDPHKPKDQKKAPAQRLTIS